jgi:hypothetical protein
LQNSPTRDRESSTGRGRPDQSEEYKHCSVQAQHVLVGEAPHPTAKFRLRDCRDLVDHQPRRRPQPVRLARLDGKTEKRRIGRVAGERADRDRERGVEAIILEDDDRPRFSGIVLPAGDCPNLAAFSSFERIRPGVDEVLILPGVGAPGHGKRLAMRLCQKCRRAYIGHPDLDRSQSLLPQPLPMGSHLVARCRRSCHCNFIQSVTCNRPDGGLSRSSRSRSRSLAEIRGHNPLSHGRAISDLSLGNGARALIDTIREACRLDKAFDALSAVKTGYWPIVLLACRHHGLPVPPQFWIDSIAPELTDG